MPTASSGDAPTNAGHTVTPHSHVHISLVAKRRALNGSSVESDFNKNV